MKIRMSTEKDIAAIVELGLAAWAPVFASFKELMGCNGFSVIFPDWKKSQQEAIEKACRDTEKLDTYVAEVDEKVVGFTSITMDQEKKAGEIYFLAVHPNAQNLGIGTALNAYVIQKMKDAGMKVVSVSTGGDISHAPARHCYEKSGFNRSITSVNYYLNLTEEE